MGFVQNCCVLMHEGAGGCLHTEQHLIVLTDFFFKVIPVRLMANSTTSGKPFDCG